MIKSFNYVHIWSEKIRRQNIFTHWNEYKIKFYFDDISVCQNCQLLCFSWSHQSMWWLIRCTGLTGPSGQLSSTTVKLWKKLTVSSELRNVWTLFQKSSNASARPIQCRKVAWCWNVATRPSSRETTFNRCGVFNFVLGNHTSYLRASPQQPESEMYYQSVVVWNN